MVTVIDINVGSLKGGSFLARKEIDLSFIPTKDTLINDSVWPGDTTKAIAKITLNINDPFIHLLLEADTVNDINQSESVYKLHGWQILMKQ